jgi:lipopolysaccharide/colanic/teichoic acid biosynthesis glycosyltransferase
MYFAKLQENEVMQLAINKDDVQVIDTTGVFINEKGPTQAINSMMKEGVRYLSKYRFWKGVFDRVLAFLALVAFSPLMVLIAVVIKLDTPGSSLYRRGQVGENGREFTAYKFRTMFTNCDNQIYHSYLVKYVQENAPYKMDENNQPVYKVVDDPRITRFGALLRKTNLDELPQLINVLKGEMSLIGPRPDVPFAVAMYQDWQRKRLGVKPGITGLWQVRGRKRLSFKHMVHLDLVYLRRQSLFLDVKILFRTIVTILTRDGSS